MTKSIGLKVYPPLNVPPWRRPAEATRSLQLHREAARDGRTDISPLRPDKEKRRRAKDGKLKNKRVCFSHPLELQTDVAKDLLLKAFAQGAFYSFRAEECDVYVCYETENGQRLVTAQTAKARIFTPEAFAEYLQ